MAAPAENPPEIPCSLRSTLSNPFQDPDDLDQQFISFLSHFIPASRSLPFFKILGASGHQDFCGWSTSSRKAS